MRRQIVQPPKKRGPPPTGKGTQIQVRIQPALLAELDAWTAKHGILTRPEAIRRLVEMGLKPKRGV
jgi:metal-responsive CopG/Arc/MetJ family transcriptional regulator